MKKLILFFTIVLILSGCAGYQENIVYTDTIITDVRITEVHYAKYSKIQGYIMYKGMMLYIDNGHGGYYYNRYRINPGDNISRTVTVTCHYENSSNPYKPNLILSTLAVDFSDFEIK
jgi:hypothetical protein